MMLRRLYLFGGAIISTIAGLLLIISDPANSDFGRLDSWSMAGIILGNVAMLIGIEGVLIARGVTLICHVPSGEKGLRGLLTKCISNGLVVTLFCYVVWGLIVAEVFGDEAFQRLIVDSAGFGVPALALAAAILSIPVVQLGGRVEQPAGASDR